MQTEEDCIDDKQEPSKPDASPAREPPVEAKLDTFQDFKVVTTSYGKFE